MIDAVISWVDGADPAHAARRAAHLDVGVHRRAALPTRFADRGELRFAVLSLLRFAPFIRTIHVVTDGQHPHPIDSLLAEHPDRIRVVDHHEIFREHSDLLPVFSSRSIEAMIHRIPGLADRFLYLNDDIFVGRPMREDDYFDGDRPILRGRIRRFQGPVAAWLRSLLRTPSPGYGAAQRAAAQSLGRRRDYLLVEHQPQPMRVTTLAAHFAGNAAALHSLASHRFRSADQPSPTSLTHHLELASGAMVLPPLDVGYVRPGRPTGQGLAPVMETLNAGAYASFCVQSLDQMTEEDRGIVIAGLERRYG